MKYKINALIITLTMTMINQCLAQNSQWCEKKRTHLERQIEYAQKYNNHHRIVELELAVKQIRHKCDPLLKQNTHDTTVAEPTPDDKHSDYPLFLSKKISAQRKEIMKAQYELEKAELTSKPSQIAEKKLALKIQKEVLKIIELELTRVQEPVAQ